MSPSHARLKLMVGQDPGNAEGQVRERTPVVPTPPRLRAQTSDGKPGMSPTDPESQTDMDDTEPLTMTIGLAL